MRHTDSEERKIRSLVPDHKEEDLSTIGAWLGSDHKQIGLDMSANWENKPPEQFTVNFSGMPMGVLSESNLTKGLQALANDGLEKNTINKITRKIEKDCSRGVGVCKLPDNLSVSVSFSELLLIDEAHICKQSDLLANIRSGDTLIVKQFIGGQYASPIKLEPFKVTTYNEPKACGANGKSKTPYVWIQLSEEHAKLFIPRNKQGFTSGWINIVKKPINP